MENYKHIIIGGGIAGGEAVEGIREMDEEGSILVITQERHRPYERPPLSKKYLVEGSGLDELVYLEAPGHYEKMGVEFALGSPAIVIDRGAKTVLLGDQREFGYGSLLLATGARADRLPLNNAGLADIFTLRTIEDSQAIRKRAKSAGRAVVIGGSFIGAETASSLTRLGVAVEMVFPGKHLLESIAPPDFGEYLHRIYQEQGVKIHSGRKPASFSAGDSAARSAGGQVESVELDNGDRLPADMVIMGVGVKLNTTIARNAGLEMQTDGGVIVDRFLRTSDPDIFAAGDIAAWPDPTFERRLRVEHWAVARNQGRAAGRAMAGDETPYTEIPYFFSDLFDLSFEVWGDLEGWDRAVRRGDFDDENGFAYFYFRDGLLTGALDAGRPDAERDALADLVAARPSLGEIGEALADPAVEIAELELTG